MTEESRAKLVTHAEAWLDHLESEVPLMRATTAANLRRVIMKLCVVQKPHPLGFYSPPTSFYAAEVAAFEKAHPFISHEKARNPDGSLMIWGRVRYHHPHVDSCFNGWVCGRYSLTAFATEAPVALEPQS